jgi:hypothetical protein
MNDRNQGCGYNGRHKPEPGIAGYKGDNKCGNGTNGHNAFNAQI